MMHALASVIRRKFNRKSVVRKIFFIFAISLILAPLASAAVSIELEQVIKGSIENLKTGANNYNSHIGGLSVIPFGSTKAASPTSGVGTTMGSILGRLIPWRQDASGNIVMGTPQKGEVYAYMSPGAIGTTTHLTASLFQKQASSAEYVADLIETFKNPLGVQTAYAQGLGFSALSPVLNLWKLFRNLAYFFFVIMFLIVGFLIMFRSKIGGQAAVTVQQALPKMIVSLLLVTFSYAIAGLMIDLMYLIIYLIVGIFTPLFPPAGITIGSALIPSSLLDIAFSNSIVQNVFGLITNGVVGSVSGAMGQIVTSALSIQEGWVGSTIGAVVQGGANIVFTLILAVAVLVSLFRVFFELLKAYVMIFFSVIFSPIILLFGAIPGQNTFATWLKGLLENLLVFPVIILLIFIAFFFSVGPYGTASTSASKGFSAPQLSSNQGTTGFAVYKSLIALGAILAMPEVLKVTKGLMKGQLGVDASTLGQNLAKGWKGGELIPGVAASHLGGLSQFPGYARWGSQSGKESGIERILIGSREERKKEAQYQREIFDKTQVDIQRRRAGLFGIATNKEINRRNAARSETPGSGKD